MRKQSTKEERRARLTLHYLLDYELSQWKPCDTPDLQNYFQNAGVEVVQDLYENEVQHDTVLKEIWDKPFSECKTKSKERFRRGKVTIHVENDRITSAEYPATSSDPSQAILQIKKKVDALNTDRYTLFATYGLYVFVNTTFVDQNHGSFVQQIMDELAVYQKDKSRQYDMLYLDQRYVLCVCDLKKNTFEHKVIPTELQAAIAQEADQWED